MGAEGEAGFDALVHAVLAGEPKAFATLSLELWPFAVAAGRRLKGGEDGAQELFAQLLERLESQSFAGLKAYEPWRERHPEKSFADWIRIVLANLARDRHRKEHGRVRETKGDDETALPTAKRLLNELASLVPVDDLGYRPPITTNQTARQILEFAGEHLPPLQSAALAAWITGEDFEAVRDRTGIADEATAMRLVRAALATLRRRFADEG